MSTEATFFRLQGVVGSFMATNKRIGECDPGTVVAYAVTEETNGMQIWVGRADNSIPDERGIQWTHAGNGLRLGRDKALEDAVLWAVAGRTDELKQAQS